LDPYFRQMTTTMAKGFLRLAGDGVARHCCASQFAEGSGAWEELALRRGAEKAKIASCLRDRGTRDLPLGDGEAALLKLLTDAGSGRLFLL
jgi:hypothetical protein